MATIYMGEWDPSVVYNSAATVAAGNVDEVEYQGALWVANFYSLDQNPMTYSSPPGQTTNPNNSHGSAGPGYPWSLASGQQVSYDAVVPSWDATVSLKAGYTSDTSIALFWHSAVVLGVGEVSSYDVYATDHATGETVLAGSTTGTSFTVNGLSASTQYTFTIAANDLTGTSGSQAMTGTAYENAYTWNENPGAGPNPTVTVSTHAAEAHTSEYFSPYLDMTLPTTDLQNLSADSGLRDLTLAFMQQTASALDSHGKLLTGVTPTLSWGGLGTATTESAGKILQEVKAVQAEGGTVTISIGGYNGHDAAVVAQQNHLSVTQLQAEYQSVITTYGVDHLDFDIENAATVDNFAANHLRDLALVRLEAANPGLDVTYTLATTANGLPTLPKGQADTAANDAALAKTGASNDYGVLQQAKADGVHIDTVNIMAMDYGDHDPGPDMALKAITAAYSVHAQLLALGIDAKIGITPMIGNNDDTTEIFSLANAHTLAAFAAANASWVAGMGEWELPRDQSEGTAHPHAAPQPDQSGVKQGDYAFADIFDQITHQGAGGATNAANSLNGTNAANMLSGLGGNDTLKGLGGSDVIDGGAGADKMYGGAGNDTYIVDNAGDHVYETNGQGTDTVYSSVSFSLAGQYVETLRLFGTGDINATGNGLANTLMGNDGDNILNGGTGADKMTGGAGSDTFLFNTALSKTNVDTITDFASGTDHIELSHTVFSALAKGALPTADFHVGAAATTADQHIIYNQSTGALYYDADGKGGHAAVEFAMLTGHPAITAADFLVA